MAHRRAAVVPVDQRLEIPAKNILEGEMTFVADGKKVVAREGTFLNIPRGVLHPSKNES